MVPRNTATALCVLTLAVSALAGGVDGAGFEQVCSWTSYDPGAQGVGVDPDGYIGGVFDGRYIYFVPYQNGTTYHGEVLRYDASGAYDDVSSWATFDPGSHGVGTVPKGFWDGVFDGRYVYFVPYRNNTGYHGEVMRYDTTAAFDDVSAWTTFDAGSQGVGDNPDGYAGGVFDGRYIYFAPYSNNISKHGEVLRYDTTGDFDDVSAWTTFDAGDYGVGEKYGYVGAVFDGRYVYLVPNCTTDTSHHGEVRRYDTTLDFDDIAAWAAFDAGDHGVGFRPDGYVGGVFDGRYIYFVPYWREYAEHGEVLRYDTSGDFATVASWAAFDSGSHGVGTDPDGYVGAMFDGRYVYFAPCRNGTDYHSEVLRLDTAGGFSDAASWRTFDASAHGVISGLGGFGGGTFDGRFVYFAPNRWYGGHGQVMRFDTATCPADLDGDTDIDLADLAQLLGHYGTTSGATCAQGDIDGDGDVDLGDLAALLGVYGTACP